MNKQEAIEKIEKLKGLNIKEKNLILDIEMIPKGEALEIVDQLDELEKPVVPQFVADFYESIKENFETKLYNYFVEFYNGWEDSNSDFDHWFNSSAEPIQTLVKMKLFGYVVKEEKLYKARNKLTNGYLCKKYDCWAEAFRFKKEDGEALTKEIWEELGVWDNKVYEMEEVDE